MSKVSLFLAVALGLLSFVYSIDYANLLNYWVCKSGSRQSPIYLNKTISEYSDQIEIHSESYTSIIDAVMYIDKTNYLVSVQNWDSAVSSTQRNYGFVILNFNGYFMRFNLNQIVVHLTSEHFIETSDGRNFYDFEVQLFHTKDLNYSPRVNKYQKMPDISEYLIISIPYTLQNNVTTVTDGGFIDRLSTIYNNNLFSRTEIDPNNNKNMLFSTINLSAYNLLNSKSHYFYKGSQTSAPCDENHFHLYLSEPFLISKSTYDFFNKQVFTTDKFSNQKNTKQIVPLNYRKLTRNFFISQEEADNYMTPEREALKKEKEDKASQLKQEEEAKKEKAAAALKTTTTVDDTTIQDYQKNKAANSS